MLELDWGGLSCRPRTRFTRDRYPGFYDAFGKGDSAAHVARLRYDGHVSILTSAASHIANTRSRIVSMTYGRPSMTSHLAPAPLPLPIPDSELENLGDVPEEEGGRTISHMTFYVATIELYKILENILSDIYNAWRSRTSKDGSAPYWDVKQGGLDVIIEIDSKLTTFEANLTPVLNWTGFVPSEGIDGVDPLILARQRNVLHARYLSFYICENLAGAVANSHRFIHLRLLLCRPIFTQICSERIGKSRSSTGTASKPGSSSETPGGNILYTSVFTNCAVSCVMAAMDLISLVYDTYKTPATDAWWYNGFCMFDGHPI